MAKFRLFLALVLFSFQLHAQNEKPLNYRKFDSKTIHFGFMLGILNADFTTYQVPDAYQLYNLKSLTVKSQPGGQLGIVSTLKLGTPVVRLRFLPTLSFQERAVNYVWANADSTKKDITKEERVESTALDFPLMLQFRTLRYNNFAAYVLAGAQFSVDLQSREFSTQSYSNPFLKISKKSWAGQIGGGVEFFTPYFKFGIELKYSHGFSDVLIHDETSLSAPVSKIYNRMWCLSFIFEG